jgi:hypothetical protein
MSTRIEGDMIVTGNLQPVKLSPPNGSIANAAIAAAPGNYVDSDKLEAQRTLGWAQPNTAATSETRTLHVVYGLTGQVAAFQAGSIAACIGAATVTIDLKKNGVSILSAPITLNSSNTARVAVAGTVTTAALAENDWLEVVITATAGGGTLATGVFCQAVLAEDPQ